MKFTKIAALACSACFFLTGCSSQPNFFDKVESCQEFTSGTVKFTLDMKTEVGSADISLNADVLNTDTMSMNFVFKGELPDGWSFVADTEEEDPEADYDSTENEEPITFDFGGDIVLADSNCYINLSLLKDLYGLNETVLDACDSDYIVNTLEEVSVDSAELTAAYKDIIKQGYEITKEVFMTDTKAFLTTYKDMPAIVINADNAEALEKGLRSVLSTKWDTFISNSVSKLKPLMDEDTYTSLAATVVSYTYSNIESAITSFKEAVVEEGMTYYIALDATESTTNVIIDAVGGDEYAKCTISMSAGTPAIQIPEASITMDDLYLLMFYSDPQFND